LLGLLEGDTERAPASTTLPPARRVTSKPLPDARGLKKVNAIRSA